MAGAFSNHLINSYTTIPHQRPAFAPFGQDVKPQHLTIHGPMSFLPTMHGSFSEQPSFADQSSMFMEISQATTQKIAKLQATLDKKLGPEYISQRPGPGGTQKLTYAEGWKIINLANEIFGFNGWSSTVVNLTVDFIDCNEESKRYTVGVTAIVRVTLRDGVFHEDIGYGMLENSKSKGQALDKCKKEAVTDGVKRALRSFGNVLGNCLYDKEYAREIIKIKVPPPKFDKDDLYRRPEYSITPSTTSRVAASSSKPPITPSRPGPPPPTTAPVLRPYRDMPPPNVPVASTSKVKEPAEATSPPRTNVLPPAPQPPAQRSHDVGGPFTEELDELLPEGASFEYTPSDDDALMLAAEIDLASGIGGPIYFENTTADMQDTSTLSKADKSSVLAGLDSDPMPAPVKAAQNGHRTNDGKRNRSHAIAAALASAETTPSPPPQKPQPIAPTSILKQPQVERPSAASSSSATERAQQALTANEVRQPPGKAEILASTHARARIPSPSSMGGGFNLPPGVAPPSARKPMGGNLSGIGIKRPADAMQFATTGAARRSMQGMGLNHHHHVGASSSSSGDPKRPRL